MNEMRLRFFVSDEEVYQHYFGDFELGKKYNSPLRRDPKPSFLIQMHEGCMLWKDFGLSQKTRPDAIGFVQELFQEERKQAVKRIWDDFMRNGVSVKSVKRSLNIGLPYDLVTHELTSSELRYWAMHCIEKPLLDRYGIKGLTELQRHGGVVWKSTPEEPAYVYPFVKDTFKIYRPLSQDRFRGQNNGMTIEGYAQLPATGTSLIVTSSMKDVLVLTSLGYNAIAPPGESNIRSVLEKARELNARFHRIYILFDNDGPGISAANRLHRHTNWPRIFLPKEVAKDPADVIKKYGNRFVLSRIMAKFAI